MAAGTDASMHKPLTHAGLEVLVARWAKDFFRAKEVKIEESVLDRNGATLVRADIAAYVEVRWADWPFAERRILVECTPVTRRLVGWRDIADVAFKAKRIKEETHIDTSPALVSTSRFHLRALREARGLDVACIRYVEELREFRVLHAPNWLIGQSLDRVYTRISTVRDQILHYDIKADPVLNQIQGELQELRKDSEQIMEQNKATQEMIAQQTEKLTRFDVVVSSLRTATPWWAGLVLCALSIVILTVASWFPPQRPEYIIKIAEALFYASLGFVIGYPIGIAGSMRLS